MTENNKAKEEKMEEKKSLENKIGDEDKKKEENVVENKEKTDKKSKIEKPKKDKAVAKGSGIHVSMKQCMYICSFIKGKSIDGAISDLGDVIKMKIAVPFKGEIPHRKGMMSGRYPINGSKEFINILKGLKGNVVVNGMDIDKTRISLASATWARRPLRRAGRKAKRTNVILEAMEIKK